MKPEKILAAGSPMEENRRLLLALIVVCGALVRLMVAYGTVHYYDISYYVEWSAGAAADLFGVYENVSSMDYPPLFLYLLKVIGALLNLENIGNFQNYRMILLKFWQITFDICIIFLLYLILSKHSLTSALFASALWAVNPTMILNAAYWGQTDSIMIFLLLLSFWQLTEKRPVAAGVVMALACLMKFQSLYFLPLFGLAMLTTYPLKRILQAALAACAAILALTLPFMLRSGPWLLWDIYFGGYEQYPLTSLNACNFYGLTGLNMQSVAAPVFGIVPAEYLSATALVLLGCLLVFFHITAPRQNVWILGAMFMQSVFMFSTRMHERYQVPVLAFLLVAAVLYGSKKLLYGYFALLIVTFFNQFIVLQLNLAGENITAWLLHFETIVSALSAVNFALYCWLMFECCRICFCGGRKNFRQSVLSLFPGTSY